MDFLVKYWGVIVGVSMGIGTIIDVIFNSAKLIRYIAIPFWHTLKWVGGRWHMFKELIYWKRHHPICRITDTSCLKITHPNGKYCMDLTVTVEFISRDKCFDTIILEDNVDLEVCYKSGFLVPYKPHYYLHCDEGRGNGIRLSAHCIEPRKVKREYTFSRESKVIPSLGDSTVCKLYLGNAKLEYTGKKPLKVEKFPVKVELGKENNTKH